MTDPSLDSRKAELRRVARAKRLATAQPGAAAALVTNFPAELAAFTVIAGYWPLGSEIDCRPLLAAFVKEGAVVALPRIAERDELPVFRLWLPDDPLSPDAYGIMAPPPNALPVTPQLVLTPLLAFDRKGGRLGQGGGHYDRTIAALRAEVAVTIAGLAYAAQEIAEVPTGPYDQSLDWIITDREAIRVR